MSISPDSIYRFDSDKGIFSFIGSWTKPSLHHTPRIERLLLGASQHTALFDFSECTAIDSAGAIEVIRLRRLMEAGGCRVTYTNLHPAHSKLLSFYENHFRLVPPQERAESSLFVRFYLFVKEWFLALATFFSFLGEVVINSIRLLFKPWQFRWVSLVKHIHTSAIQALPIVMMLSFLIGLVVAYQSAGYLGKISGDILIVDLSVMSVFRELSPMIAAILMAARSASSFTAQIGTMKITEEIDAMKTMGFNPVVFLVLPRILALVLAMPLLIFAADMAGMAGAMVVSYFHLGIGVHEFIDRMHDEIAINELYVGLGKSPVYGAIVATVGCYRGFQVQGSTESIGAYTTKSAVSVIFWVIICDAIIAVALTRLGI